MKISVIVPVYNRLEHLRAQLICLMKQKTQPYELIITDDGSREKVLEYIEDLLKEVKFKVKHVYQEDKGFRKTRALNNGVKESTGDYLVFCDQDLVFGEDYLEVVKNRCKKGEFLHFRPVNLTSKERDEFVENIENKNFSYGEFTKNLDEDHRISVKRTLKKDRMKRLINKLGFSKRGIKLVGMSYGIFKDDYIKVNGYDEKYQGWGYEDDDFGNRLYMGGIKGREGKTKELQLHLWHHLDPTKKKSLNEDYYKERREKVLENGEFFCEYGYNNSLEKDEIKVEVLK